MWFKGVFRICIPRNTADAAQFPCPGCHAAVTFAASRHHRVSQNLDWLFQPRLGTPGAGEVKGIRSR
ncbi:hypothetical protein CSE45_1488 [Citreicella sp. SE45]|nr:hypothetical protein CSE45_1488 [Citreicella sp. SE45]